MHPAESRDGQRPQELSDDELISEWRSRSGAARDAVVEALFERHYQRVARWCYRFTNDREAAADLAQEVFLKAHRHLDGFKGTSAFLTWLYSIVRNESLNWLKRLRTDVESEEVLADVAALDARPDAVAEARDLAARLKEFLTANLDRTEQAVFTLHYGDDMTLDAITRLLRLDNASGAKAYIVSARRKLARAAQRVRARGGFR
jgi:RNA polymerase sigma-70 factor (ECF subfamily)